MTDVTRAATNAAYLQMSEDEQAKIDKAVKRFREELKAMCPSVQISEEGIREIIGAAYAWKAAGGATKPKAHLHDLAKYQP
jgi:F0F1-type ATP synthase membrane subunit b/b'